MPAKLPANTCFFILLIYKRKTKLPRIENGNNENCFRNSLESFAKIGTMKILDRNIYFRSGYVLFGFLGNQPFKTRSSCSKTSLIDQNEEKANTPQIVEPNIFSINKEAIAAKIPPTKKSHQLFVPQ